MTYLKYQLHFIDKISNGQLGMWFSNSGEKFRLELCQESKFSERNEVLDLNTVGLEILGVGKEWENVLQRNQLWSKSRSNYFLKGIVDVRLFNPIFILHYFKLFMPKLPCHSLLAFIKKKSSHIRNCKYSNSNNLSSIW